MMVVVVVMLEYSRMVKLQIHFTRFISSLIMAMVPATLQGRNGRGSGPRFAKCCKLPRISRPSGALIGLLGGPCYSGRALVYSKWLGKTHKSIRAARVYLYFFFKFYI